MAEIKEKSDAKNKPITAAVILVLCAIFVVGFIYGLNSVLAMEGSFPPSDVKDGVTVLPDTKQSSDEDIAKVTNENIAEYLHSVLQAALSNEAKISTGRDNYIVKEDGDFVISSDGSDTFNDTLEFLADDVDEDDRTLGEMLLADYESKSTDFGEDMSGILQLPEISAEDIESFEIAYIYYQCPSCGETSDDPCDSCEACGSTYAYNTKYRDEYTVTLKLVNNEDILTKNFTPRTDDEIKALLKEGTENNFTIDKLERSYDTLTITFKVDRLTDHITYLAYEKQLTVDTSLTFTGDWEAIGNADVSFKFAQKDKFNFTWPGLELDEHSLAIEPGATDNLLATLTCSAPTEMTVIWTSSDEEAVTVDEEGYLKANKNADGKSAVITAEYEFNGKKYSDSCEVKVMYSVESTSLKKTKAKLSAGETFGLEVKFDPSNSTDKTVTWYSEDESIATVDENGVVTAVAPGSVTVYSISNDGYFKSSCEVTVE